MCVDNRSLELGCPIRKFLDQSLVAAPQDLSQRTTSFIASQRQGIHRIPFWHLIALINRCSPLGRGSDPVPSPFPHQDDKPTSPHSSIDPKDPFASNAPDQTPR